MRNDNYNSDFANHLKVYSPSCTLNAGQKIQTFLTFYFDETNPQIIFELNIERYF